MNTNNEAKKKNRTFRDNKWKNQFISISSSSAKLHWRTIENNTLEDVASPSRDTPAEIRVYLTLNKRNEGGRSSNDFFPSSMAISSERDPFQCPFRVSVPNDSSNRSDSWFFKTLLYFSNIFRSNLYFINHLELIKIYIYKVFRFFDRWLN